MRIITGTARGRRLITLDGSDVRPTPEKVKESLFSAIQFDIEGRRVLDLFAGSGQLGLEALSRGAESAVFVDSSGESVKVVRQNLENTGLSDKAKVFLSDWRDFVSVNRDIFDIVFLDPPYKAGFLEPAVKAVCPFMSGFGIIICEHPPEIALPQAVCDFEISRQYRHGKVIITTYRKAVNS